MAKKWLGAALSGALLMTVLAGCGSNSSSAPAGGTSTSTKKEDITVTILNAQDNGVRDKFLANIVKPEFEKQNPGMKLEIITTPYEQFDSKMSTLVAAGTPPDVWSQWGRSGFVDYYTRGLTLDLTPYLADIKNPNIKDETMKIYNVDGKQHGIPYSIYPSMIYYNKDIFKNAGIDIPQYQLGDKAWTWDKLVELSKKVSKDYGKPSAVYGFTYNMGTHMATYSWDWGYNIFQDGYQTGYLKSANLTDPKFVDAVKFFQGLIFKDKISPSQSIKDALVKTGDPLVSGKVAMDLNGAWRLGALKNTTLNYGVLPLPTGPAGTATPFLYTDPLMVSSKSKHPDAAVKLVKLMTSPEIQAKLVTETGNPPADTAAFKEWYKQFSKNIDPAYLQSITEASLAKGKESPNHLIAGYSEVTTFMRNEQQAIFVNGDDPAKALADINTRFNKLLSDIVAKSSNK
jgi:multiple sugar transport system substrate-binding protein